MSITPDELGALEKALKTDGVWVDPALRSKVSATDLREIKQAQQAAHQAHHTTYVIIGDVAYNDPHFPRGMDDVLATVHDDLGHDGAYIGTSLSYGDPETTVYTAPDDFDADQAWFPAHYEEPHDVGAQIAHTIAWIDKGGAGDWQKPSTSGSSAAPPAAPHSSGGHTGAILGGVVAAVIVLAALAAVIARVRRRTPRFRPSRRVLTAVHRSTDQQYEARAQADVLALGEAIDKADVDAHDAPAAWQAALDHYAAARTLLDRDHRPADAVGAIVLARWGREALARAEAGKDWAPAKPCYFNPLHGRAGATVAWAGRAGSASVPVCTACAPALRAGREPDDVLDFMVGNEARHYYDLRLEPWSSTGYGALDPDLLVRLGETSN